MNVKYRPYQQTFFFYLIKSDDNVTLIFVHSNVNMHVVVVLWMLYANCKQYFQLFDKIGHEPVEFNNVFFITQTALPPKT